MSDILIKGMKMPTSCIACRINFGEKRPEYGLTICCPYSEGVISWRDQAFDNGRLASCGIVPVLKHGNLIDEAELWVEINKICDRRDAGIISDLTCLQQILTALRHAPTIISASEEETE